MATSLWKKLLALFLGVFFLSIGGLTYFAYHSSSEAMEREFHIRGGELAKAIAFESRTYYLNDDVEGFTTLLQSLGEAEDVVAILAYDATNALWVESSTIELTNEEIVLRTNDMAWHRETTVTQGSFLSEFGRAVMREPSFAGFSFDTPTRRLGWIRILFDRGLLEERLDALVLQISIVSTIVTGIGGMIFVFLLRRSLKIIGPLTAATQHVAKGNLDTTVPVTSRDELGQLATCFNQMTEQLHKTTVSKQYVDNIIRSMVDTLIVIRPDGQIRTLNQATLHLLGYEESELVGQHIDRVFPNHDGSFTVVELDPIVSAGRLDHMETVYLTKDGHRIPVLFSAAVMRTDDGTIQGIACVAQDITERKRAQQKLQEANTKLQELDRSRSQFFADISHELRTPLTVIRGEAEVTLLTEHAMTSDYTAALKRIVSLTRGLNKLVSDLLFLARSETGMIEVERQPTSLDEVLTEASREGEVLARQKSITITLHGGHEPIIVDGDAYRLKQLFMILVSNAISYTPEYGRVDVHVKQDADCGHVTIQDSGVGIPETEMPHVFERFYRAKTSPAHAQGGTGLGLSIAKWIIEAHHGTISLASKQGVGTTVTLTLPILVSTTVEA
ncbi:MAG TPA: PAS domain S-box protein [Nitrospirales bacterium]|nr:PAS domain S-box protein [Nitrospirales bacterium]